EPGGIAPEDARAALQPELLDIVPDQGAGPGGDLDEQAEAGAARKRLQAEGAGAGKQVEDPCLVEQPGKAVLQDVEQRLAHAVRGRAGGIARRRTQAAAAKLTGD